MSQAISREISSPRQRSCNFFMVKYPHMSEIFRRDPIVAHARGPVTCISSVTGVSHLEWRIYLERNLVQSIIQRAHLHLDSPVSTHCQVARSAKAAFAVRLEIHRIGAHTHIEHRGIDRDANLVWTHHLARTDVDDLHCEDVGTKAVW